MKKILLIEDSLTQQKSFQIAFEKNGYEVIVAKDGIDGIHKAYKFFPDLIVSDIVMPKINGYQICRLLKNDENTKNIPIILLTVLKQKIDRFWGLRAGADSFVVKSNDMSDLIKETARLLSYKEALPKEQKPTITTGNEADGDNYYSKIAELLDKALIETTIINDFRNLSEFILDTETLNNGIFSLLSSIIDYNIAGIFFNERDESKERPITFDVEGIEVEEKLLEEIKDNFFKEVFPNAEIESVFSTIKSRDVEKAKTVTSLKEFASSKIIPIVYLDRVLGGLCLFHTEPNKFNETNLLKITLKELKMLMRVRWLYSETKYLAIVDGLTGLYNRRNFQHTMDREFSRAKRYKQDLTIAMFDIDNFKSLNDTCGHQFGDRVLFEVSKIIKNHVRKSDYAARYGGEELIVILSNTDLENAIIPIERIREKIENSNFKFGENRIPVTVSIGMAELSSDIQEEKELIKRCDIALYKAKKRGKNRLETFDGKEDE